jgi:predicted small secreted protein
MKKYSIVVALVVAFGISLSSCHTSAKVGTKHHEVGVGGHVH